MGQTKKLLDEIWELETTITYPDDLDKNYEDFICEQNLLYQEKELSLSQIKTKNHE